MGSLKIDALTFFLILTSLWGCQTTPKKDGKTVESEFIRSNYAPGELTRLCDASIKSTTEKLDQIAKTPQSERTLKNTLLQFEKVTSDFNDSVTPLTFMGYVSTDEAISKEGSDCEQKVSQFYVSIFTRKDLYRAIKDQSETSPQEKRLLSETIKAFEENGLKLSDARLEEVKKLKLELALLETKFSTHLNQDKTEIELDSSELEGVPTDFLNSLKKSNHGKFIVTTKRPHFERVMENAVHEETRRKMLIAYESRAAKENTPLLEEAIQVRQKIANLMGYQNWVDYRVHSRMAKNSKNVIQFLNDLKSKLSARNKKDLDQLLKLKKEQDPSIQELKAWDILYYSNQLKKRDLHLDDEKIREYFPADHVVSGMFQIYSKLLGVEFIEQKDAKTWANQVQLYAIQDSKNHEVISYFYADFIPRPGKYGHAAAFPLISARTLETGKYSRPVAAIVANFTPPEGGKPSLLNHNEVETLFHEFGHIMHQTLTRAPYASLAGSNVDQDFVEAPSQMLENWVYWKEILTLVSGHYQDHSKKLPDDLLQKLIEARDFNQGYFYTRQLLFALLDMNYHTAKGPVDSVGIYRKLHKELMGIDCIEGSYFPANFGHLMGGYDAGYYGYLWSEVYAMDMFSRFESDGLLNPQLGLLYRKTILEKGKMEDADELLKQFLGRKPNPKAFYKRLHI